MEAGTPHDPASRRSPSRGTPAKSGLDRLRALHDLTALQLTSELQALVLVLIVTPDKGNMRTV